MYMDMLKPKAKMPRFAIGDAPAEFPEHAFEVIVEPGTRREIGFIEPPVNGVKRAFPGRIDAPYFYEQKLYTLRYDKDGFLLGGPRDDDPDATVVMLGDSTSEDRYLDEDARTSSRAAIELRELTGLRVNVHNAAVSGAHSLNSLLSLVVKVLPMQPRAATLMHVSNDLKQLLYFGSYWEAFGQSTMLRPQRETAATGSRLAEIRRDPATTLRKLARRALRLIPGRSHPIGTLPSKSTKAVWWEYMTPERGFALRDPALLQDSFARNLNLFVSICRHSGIAPVLLTQPNRLTAKGPDEVLKTQMSPLFRLGMPYDEYKALFDGFNDVVRRVAAAQGAALVDLAETVPQEPRFIWDSLHLTVSGAAFAARQIAATLSTLVTKGSPMTAHGASAP
jgi:lysophospholipase L1-like esterase